jgi:two-component system sensor histidine kinase RpfC
MARSDGAAYGSTGEASRREPASASVVEIGRVLVVEDNATNRMVASTILQQAGYAVSLAESGEAALLHLVCEAYDLVLLDMTMPGMSGVDLLTRLRAHVADFGHVPCVMLTANATPQSRQLCEAAGADAFLTKPVNAEALVQTVRSIARTDSAAGAEVPRRGVLDVEKLKQHLTLGGDAFLRDLMDGYQSDGERSVVELQRTVDKGEEGQVHAHLHAMEGSAAEVGATGVMAACSALRVALQTEDPSSWAAALAHLRTVFAATCALLDRVRELGLVHREEPGLTEGTGGPLPARAFPGEEPSGAVAP